MSQLVRDAMLRDPLALDASASAQEAGQRLADRDVRAVLVCDGGRLVGVVTRKTLVREVVAAGLDPRRTPLGQIAEDPLHTLDADMPLEDAFRDLEERDLERVPVTEGDGRLAGVLSRSVVQRRLAEDEEPVEAGDEPVGRV
jgi:CBS domain-containing protein